MRFSFAPLLATVVFIMSPAAASAASLYLDPAEGTYGPGDTFILSVRLGNDDTCINAAHVELTYPKDSLRAVDFGKGGSIFPLFAEEPVLDTEHGLVTFSGGVPGGYCGRIEGDPGLSNTLGRVVFTVTNSSAKKVSVDISTHSLVYLNDGFGTSVSPKVTSAAISLAATPTQKENPWLAQVKSDTILPEPFDVEVQSTKGVFSGHYYLVFSTEDKQSGVDHYELLEHAGWKTVTSPYEVRDASLLQQLRLKAVDKAGNERIANFSPEKIPARQYSVEGYIPLSIIGILLLLAIFTKMLLDRRAKRDLPPVP